MLFALIWGYPIFFTQKYQNYYNKNICVGFFDQMGAPHHDQNAIQTIVQQNVQNFVKMLPKHVSGWKSALEDSTVPLQGLLNRAEQLRHVEKWAQNGRQILAGKF